MGLVILCASNVTTAEQLDAQKEPAGSIRIIIMLVRPNPAEISPIEQTIVSQLADLDAEVDFYHTRQPFENEQQQDHMALRLLTVNRAAAVFVISPLEDRSLQIFIQRDNKMKTSSRAVDVSNGMPLHEAVAVIVRATTNMLIEEAASVSKDAALSPQLVESRKSTPVSPTPETAHTDTNDAEKQNVPNHFLTGVGLALTKFSGDYPISLGLHIHIGWQPMPHFRMSFGGTFFSKESSQKSDVSITLRHHPIYLGIGYTRSIKRLTLEGGAAFGLDVVTEQFHSDSDTLSVGAEQTELQPSLHFYMQGEIAISPLWRIYIRLGGAVSFRHTNYAIVTPDGSEYLIESLPVSPMARIGTLFHFF